MPSATPLAPGIEILGLFSGTRERGDCFRQGDSGPPSLHDRNLQRARVLRVVIEDDVGRAGVLRRLVGHHAAGVVVFLEPNRVGAGDDDLSLNDLHDRKSGIHPSVEASRERADEREPLIDQHARHTGG